MLPSKLSLLVDEPFSPVVILPYKIVVPDVLIIPLFVIKSKVVWPFLPNVKVPLVLIVPVFLSVSILVWLSTETVPAFINEATASTPSKFIVAPNLLSAEVIVVFAEPVVENVPAELVNVSIPTVPIEIFTVPEFNKLVIVVFALMSKLPFTLFWKVSTMLLEEPVWKHTSLLFVNPFT